MPSDNEIKQLMIDKGFPFFEKELPALRERLKLLEEGLDVKRKVIFNPETGLTKVIIPESMDVFKDPDSKPKGKKKVLFSKKSK